VKYLLMIFISIAMSGCGTIARIDPMPSAQQVDNHLATDLKASTKRIQELSQLLSEEEANHVQLVNAHNAAVLLWTAAALAAVAAGCGILVFVLPIGQRILIGLAIGCGAAAVASLWLGQHVTWLPYLGGSLVLLVVITGIYLIHRHVSGAMVVASEWQRYSDFIRQKDSGWVNQLDAASFAIQAKSKTQAAVQALLNRAT
jgi:hypothetical protein